MLCNSFSSDVVDPFRMLHLLNSKQLLGDCLGCTKLSPDVVLDVDANEHFCYRLLLKIAVGTAPETC